MPDGYEYTKLSRAEYERALRALLGLTESEKPRGKDKKFIEQALQRYDIEGWNINLPRAIEASSGRSATDWRTQYEKALEQWKGDVTKATQETWGNRLTVAKWEQDEAWRRYNAQIAEQERETQRWQQRRGRQSEMWENWRAQQNVLAEQYNWQAQRMAGAWAKPDDTAARAAMFEAARGEILASLGEPQDWIKRWQVQNMENPHKPRDMGQEVAATREEVKNLREANRIIRERQKDPSDPLYLPNTLDIMEGNISPEQWQAAQLQDRLKTAEDKLLEFSSSPEYIEGRRLAEIPVSETEGRGYESVEPTQPTTPLTPGWLKKIYPEMGARIPERGAIGQQFGATPLSGQWLSRMTPSELGGWAGYAEYTGASPQDLLWQTQQQLPQPRRGTSWKPARQRVSV